MANTKAAYLGSTPTQEEGAFGGLLSQCSNGRCYGEVRHLL